ncbi:MAG: UDP-3-O-(3-hydroxymyristoyl)glucosamine N-acyltransferase [Planctomycetes bacterium]|nr:UDP-3-O-(3-hydroxymyristoyl)glucosamine N-acyltransferase [Planctomycetota bacterium]
MKFRNVKVKELVKELELVAVGDTGKVLNGVAGVEDAVEGDLSFIRSSKYNRWLVDSKASALIVPQGITLPEGCDKVFLLSENPYLSFASVLKRYFCPPNPVGGVSERAHVSKSATLGKDVTVEPFVFISDNAVIGDRCHIQSGVRIGSGVTIGCDTEIRANVVLDDNTQVGMRVKIHPNVVIGAEGFGYAQTEEGNVKFPQVGRVIIGNDVEIGSGTTIDRASMGCTIIGEGTKIDNLVQIGHGVKLGKHNVICSQVGIAGSVVTGDKVIIAVKAGISDHLKLGDHVTVGPLAGVTKDLSEGTVASGYPAMPHTEWLKVMGAMHQLPVIREHFREIQKNR